jgi:hypothetical protein
VSTLDTMKTKPLPADLAALTPLERARKIPLAEAAAHNSIHPDTFRRNYAHLLRRVGRRRFFVTVEDAITLPAPRK